MRIISHNEPLLFVHGPPVYIRVAVTDEESTSVFVSNGEEKETDELGESELGEIKNAGFVNPSIVKKIFHLGGPFQRQVYRPLKFIIGDETLSGEITSIDGDTVFIDLDGEKDLIVAIEINKIEEVLWRGKPFQED